MKIETSATPANWCTVSLSEVCTHITDGTHRTPNYQDAGIRFISIKNIRPFKPVDWDSYVRFISEREHKELTKRCSPERDDVLFPRIGTLGFAKRIDFDEPVSIFVGLGLLKPDKRVIRPKYLEYYMNAPWIAALSQERANGSGRMTLPLEETRQFPILLPPLQEQDRIVASIETSFTRLDASELALTRVKNNLNRYKASVLKAACEGRLVPTEAELARKESRTYETGEQLLARILKERRTKWEADQLAKMCASGKPPNNDAWREKYQQPESPDTHDLPELPEGWTWVGLDSLGEVNRGKSKHRPRNDPRLMGGPYPFIQTGDVKNSSGSVREHSATYSEFGLSQSRLWPEGTLCITIAANIADTGILTYPACFPDSVVGFIAVLPITARWVQLFIATAKQSLERYAPATAQKNINLETLYRIAVPFPPESEQERIMNEVERLFSALRCADVTAGNSLFRADRLRQAILKCAFEGKLVPQDPNDEPALTLLKRIRSEGNSALDSKSSKFTKKAKAIHA
jgi:type I restriction enzyme S subunit